MALDNDTVVILLQALKSITAKSTQCFTAYDVTKALRSLAKTTIAHKDVRQVIHKFYDEDFLNQYSRESHVFQYMGDTIRSELFVPAGGDPNDYNPDDVVMLKVSDNDKVDSEEDEEPSMNGLHLSDPSQMIGSTGIVIK